MFTKIAKNVNIIQKILQIIQKNMRILLYLGLMFFLFSCVRGPIELKSHFNPNNLPPEIDYSKEESWAALPTKVDLADSLPKVAGIVDGQKNAKVDVFFIHPTIFTYEPTNNYVWNGDINDVVLNEKTDNSTILNQATAFNGSCRVYAPRYRQAHYYSFVTMDKDDSQSALNLAYSDVKNAFEYYLKNKNQNRPIIIASHSQGTVHAKRLLKEYFDGTELQKKLVMAYIIGVAVPSETFTNLKPSESATQIGCYAAWNTFSKGFYPKNYEKSLINTVCTNPLTWSSSDSYSPHSKNLGGIGPKFKFYPNIIDAQTNKGLLWVSKPKVPGAFLLRQKVWHIADINFFWMNIRENTERRIASYFQEANK